MEKLEQTPMSDKVKERIERDAANLYSVEFNPVCWMVKREGYIAGATAERPKAWNEAIDEVIEMMKENPIGLDAIDEQYLERLGKLKHKQP